MHTFLLCTALVLAAQAQAVGEESVTGLWAYQTSFPVGLAGTLTLTRRGATWQGSIGGATAEAVGKGSGVRLYVPHEGGTFRGYLDGEGRLLRGFWVRREIIDDPRYPEGAAQGYAMPLALRPSGADRWQATVAPLADPFTLYLNIFRDDSGALKAAMRNPEHHRHGPAMQLFATLDGDRLRLGAAAEPGEDDLIANVRRESGRIEIRWESMRSHDQPRARHACAGGPVRPHGREAAAVRPLLLERHAERGGLPGRRHFRPHA